MQRTPLLFSGLLHAAVIISAGQVLSTQTPRIDHPTSRSAKGSPRIQVHLRTALPPEESPLPDTLDPEKDPSESPRRISSLPRQDPQDPELPPVRKQIPVDFHPNREQALPTRWATPLPIPPRAKANRATSPPPEQISTPSPPKPAPTPPRVRALYTPPTVHTSENLPPHYPARAIRRNWEGSVLLKVSIHPNGRVNRIEVLEPSQHAILDRAAVQAVEKWTFRPARQGDLPIPGTLEVPVIFRLSN
ncbi:MAG: TonB family protein [Planctomycetota bacterium]|nr:TonB family protein [Planctomycetota bacterium]